MILLLVFYFCIFCWFWLWNSIHTHTHAHTESFLCLIKHQPSPTIQSFGAGWINVLTKHCPPAVADHWPLYKSSTSCHRLQMKVHYWLYRSDRFFLSNQNGPKAVAIGLSDRCPLQMYRSKAGWLGGLKKSKINVFFSFLPGALMYFKQKDNIPNMFL